MTESQKVALASIQQLPAGELNQVLRTIDLKQAGVLDAFTDNLADFVEGEAGNDLYRDALIEAISEVLEDLKLPVWLSWVKGRITALILAWLYDNGTKIIVRFLRRLR